METFIGHIILFAGDFAPRGWTTCDGRMMSISDHGALFSVLGTRYGGDGRSTFDLRGRVASRPSEDRTAAPPVHVAFIIALEGLYPSRS